MTNSNWTTSWENLSMPYANNKGADQPAHLHSLISAFVVCCLGIIIPVLAKYNLSFHNSSSGIKTNHFESGAQIVKTEYSTLGIRHFLAKFRAMGDFLFLVWFLPDRKLWRQVFSWRGSVFVLFCRKIQFDGCYQLCAWRKNIKSQSPKIKCK